MSVEVVEDSTMDVFKAGDLVQFTLNEDEEVYSYLVPNVGTFGIIKIQTFSHGLEQMLGVKIPMSIVDWEGGQEIAVFSHDIRKPNMSDVNIDVIIKRIKEYSGSDKN